MAKFKFLVTIDLKRGDGAAEDHDELEEATRLALEDAAPQTVEAPNGTLYDVTECSVGELPTKKGTTP